MKNFERFEKIWGVGSFLLVCVANGLAFTRDVLDPTYRYAVFVACVISAGVALALSLGSKKKSTSITSSDTGELFELKDRSSTPIWGGVLVVSLALLGTDLYISGSSAFSLVSISDPKFLDASHFTEDGWPQHFLEGKLTDESASQLYGMPFEGMAEAFQFYLFKNPNVDQAIIHQIVVTVESFRTIELYDIEKASSCPTTVVLQQSTEPG